MDTEDLALRGRTLGNRKIVRSCDGEAGKEKESWRNWYDDGG